MFDIFLRKVFGIKESSVKMYPESPDSISGLPEELLTSESVQAIHSTMISGGAIVTLRKGKTYLSLAAMQYNGDERLNLNHLMTAKKYRKQGYATQLLENLLLVTDRNSMISTSIDTNNYYYASIRKIIEKQGFVKIDSYHTYLGKKDRIAREKNEKMISVWQHMYEKILQNGYRCISFSEATPSMLEQIQYSASSEFQNTLKPSHFFHISGYIHMEYSFLLLEKDTVIAYTLLSDCGKNTLEFDQIAEHVQYRRSGLIMAPLFQSYLKILKDENIQKVVFQIFEQNEESKKCMDYMRCMFSFELTDTKLDFFQLIKR